MLLQAEAWHPTSGMGAIVYLSFMAIGFAADHATLPERKYFPTAQHILRGGLPRPPRIRVRIWAPWQCCGWHRFATCVVVAWEGHHAGGIKPPRQRRETTTLYAILHGDPCGVAMPPNASRDGEKPRGREHPPCTPSRDSLPLFDFAYDFFYQVFDRYYADVAVVFVGYHRQRMTAALHQV